MLLLPSPRIGFVSPYHKDEWKLGLTLAVRFDKVVVIAVYARPG